MEFTIRSSLAMLSVMRHFINYYNGPIIRLITITWRLIDIGPDLINSARTFEKPQLGMDNPQISFTASTSG